MTTCNIQYKQQTGSALIVSLSILLILTILGVSAMRTASLEERMAGNSRDSQMAFEAAEAALRAAEADMVVTAGIGAFVAAGSAYLTPKGNNPEGRPLTKLHNSTC